MNIRREADKAKKEALKEQIAENLAKQLYDEKASTCLLIICLVMPNVIYSLSSYFKFIHICKTSIEL